MIEHWERFEIDICGILAGMGYWAHRLSKDVRGTQPFDVIAARDGRVIGVECKVCLTNRFRLDRVEINQITALGLFMARGNADAWFAFRRKDLSTWFTRADEIIGAINAGMTALPAGEVPLGDWRGIYADQDRSEH